MFLEAIRILNMVSRFLIRTLSLLGIETRRLERL
jgi:hypothetical protein